jgi:hypothetical protein
MFYRGKSYAKSLIHLEFSEMSLNIENRQSVRSQAGLKIFQLLYLMYSGQPASKYQLCAKD